MSSHQGHTTTNHDEIRRWAEERGAKPARVKGTGGSGDVGMIRLDFPGYSGADSLEPISWSDWFRAFDENNLALVYQDTTSSGERSSFNKLVSREASDAQMRGDSRESRHETGSRKGASSSSTRHSKHTMHASGDEYSLNEREYRDEHGQIHHHTRPYMDRHDTERRSDE